MSYPSMVRRLQGSASGTGAVVLKQNPVGFFDDAGSTSAYVADTPLISWDVQIGGAATVTIQGNDGDPSTAGDWYDISTVTSSSVVKDVRHTTFTRVNVDAYTSGSVVVKLAASQF